MYIRSRVKPVNPNTNRQQAVRNALSVLAQAWQTLNPAQRGGWQVYADNVPIPNAFGEPKAVPPLAMYQRCNSPRLLYGLARIDQAPGIQTMGDPLDSLTIANLSEATLQYDVSFTPGTLTAADSVLVGMGRPVSPAVNFFKGPWRANADVTGTTPVAIAGDAAQPVVGNFTQFQVQAGQKVFFRARVSYSDGRLSNYIVVPATVVA